MKASPVLLATAEARQAKRLSLSNLSTELDQRVCDQTKSRGLATDASLWQVYTAGAVIAVAASSWIIAIQSLRISTAQLSGERQ